MATFFCAKTTDLIQQKISTPYILLLINKIDVDSKNKGSRLAEDKNYWIAYLKLSFSLKLIHFLEKRKLRIKFT